jgi:hypothetical protein
MFFFFVGTGGGEGVGTRCPLPFDVLVMGEKISLAWGGDPNTGPKRTIKLGDNFVHKIHIRVVLLVGNG